MTEHGHPVDPVASLDETAGLGEDTILVDDQTAAEPLLRVPDLSESVNGSITIGEKDLKIFCRTGLLPFSQADQPNRNADLIPAILHSYLGGKTFRRPWPLVINYTRSGVRIESLTSIFDSLANAVEVDGDAGALQKRALYQLEHLIVDASTSKTVLSVPSLLKEIETELLNPSENSDDQKSSVGRAEANAIAVQSFLSQTDNRSSVIGFGVTGLVELLVATSVQVSDGRHRTFRDDIEWLISRLEDLIRVEEEDSDEGHTPEKLEQSVGGAYTNTIDFSSLSHLLDEAPHGTAIDKNRRQRIGQTLSDLRDLSNRLYSDDRSVCFETSEDALQELHARVSVFTQLARARQVAQLEVENQYRPDVHDQLFESFGYESIPVNERKAFPPVLVHLHADEAGHIDGVDELLRAFGEAGSVRSLITYSQPFDDNAMPSSGLGAASAAVVRGDVFVQQMNAAQADFLADGMKLSSRSRGSSMLTVCTGYDTAIPGIDSFMSAALAGDSRAVPSFRFDPDNGTLWADWFTASDNEQPQSIWASESVSMVDGGQTNSLILTTTCADVLSIDSRFAKHFLVLAPSVQVSSVIELTDFLELDESNRSEKQPYIWIRDAHAFLLRAVLSPAIVRAVLTTRKRWKIVQEWSGINSSILARGLEDTEEASRQKLEEAIASAQADFDRRMSETTDSLAHNIVENIAASLLGLQPGSAPLPTVRVAPAQAVTTSTTHDQVSPTDAPVDELVQQEPTDDDDFELSLDEAYIDTPLCTSCNECTDLNGLIFGYDGEKQAYIKDASAGPFRDMVLAAEKCPVRIIHPGKPLDDSEKDLDEWVERAKPFQ